MAHVIVIGVFEQGTATPNSAQVLGAGNDIIIVPDGTIANAQKLLNADTEVGREALANKVTWNSKYEFQFRRIIKN